MAEFKLTIAEPKKGLCIQKTEAGPGTKNLIGLKIGDKVKGDWIDYPGYEFEITGGSDYCGFPMRKGIMGQRKVILTAPGVGFRSNVRGIKVRKTVAGDTVHEKTVQINLKILKHGEKAIEFPVKEKKKEEAPKE